jgi:thiol-disulfide isomerase/thioredoxin
VTITVRHSKLAAMALAMAAGVLLLIGFLRGAATTAHFAAVTACSPLRPNPLPSNLVGRIPEFSLPDLGGRTISSSSLRGRPVLISFFATWCPPCVEEIPSLEILAERLGTKATVLVVSVDEDEPALRKFFAKGTRTIVTRDEARSVPTSFGTSKFPESFLLDSTGKIRHAFVNQRDWSLPEAVTCVESMK